MRTTRRTVLQAGLALAAMAGGPWMPSARADTLRLRYNRWLPATHHADTDVHAPWFEEVKEATDGRVEIEFTASSLGPAPRQYELVSAGIADLSFGSEVLTPGRFPLSEIVELPFLGRSTYANSVGYWRVYEKHFAQVDPYPEVKLLSLSTLPSYHLYTTSKVVETVDDWRGLKIRATGTSLTDMLRTLGAEAVPANVTELHDVLSRGIVDGMLGNDDQVRSFGVARHFRYKTEFPGGLTSLGAFLVVNKAQWARIAPEDQATIESMAGEALSARMGRAMDNSVALGLQELKDAGAEAISADHAMVEAIQERSAFLEERWLEKAAHQGVDGELALADLREWVRSLGD